MFLYWCMRTNDVRAMVMGICVCIRRSDSADITCFFWPCITLRCALRISCTKCAAHCIFRTCTTCSKTYFGIKLQTWGLSGRHCWVFHCRAPVPKGHARGNSWHLVSTASVSFYTLDLVSIPIVSLWTLLFMTSCIAHPTSTRSSYIKDSHGASQARRGNHAAGTRTGLTRFPTRKFDSVWCELL